MNIKKKHWLYLEPYCFIFMKKSNALIYNSLSSSKIEVVMSGKLGEFIKKLKVPKNMYCVEIGERDLKDKHFINFANKLKSTFSGDVVDASFCKIKPTIMYPELKLQREIKTLEKMKEMPVGTNALIYLNEILIQINGECDINCSFCNNAYRQTIFCTQNLKQLDIKDIKKILNQLPGIAIHCLHITGGNIFKYSELNDLIFLLNSVPCQINYHLHYGNVLKYINEISFLNNENSLILIKVNFPVENEKIQYIFNRLKDEKIYHNWHFLIESQKEYEKYEEICSKFCLGNTEIFPFYNNFNIDFFNDKVYLNKDDVFSIQSNRREVFAKSVLNINNFGKLTIMADGKVYSNVNYPSIGDVQHPLSELVHTELKKGTSWFDIRDKKPCTGCVYQWLCPSPSNYELAIGKPNLCHVKP